MGNAEYMGFRFKRGTLIDHVKRHLHESGWTSLDQHQQVLVTTHTGKELLNSTRLCDYCALISAGSTVLLSKNNREVATFKALAGQADPPWISDSDHSYDLSAD